MNILSEKIVSYSKTEYPDYPQCAPYSPSVKYPEYHFDDLGGDNYAYATVREALYELGLDANNYGKKEWNPLGGIITPGDSVLVKPNMVLDCHENNGELYSVITHPSIIRAVCDYVCIALGSSGSITIADAPQANANFNRLITEMALDKIVEYYKTNSGISVSVLDLRQMVLNSYDDSSSRRTQSGDPMGYRIVDLSKESEYEELENIERIYGADFDRSEVFEHHSEGRHEYCIAQSILNAQVIINIPKLKTHRKAGVTLAMKNFVGINGNKNYLPHFRIGAYDEGGDEFQKLSARQKNVTHINRFFKDKLLARKSIVSDRIYRFAANFYHTLKKIHVVENTSGLLGAGSWYGNDTIWRMIVDLNRILIYVDRNGKLCNEPQRKVICIIDGIWAGEKDGPLRPEAVKAGVVVCGINPLLTDTVTTKLIGLNYKLIPQICNAYTSKHKMYMLTSVCDKDIVIHYQGKSKSLNSLLPICYLEPAEGWTNILQQKEANI